MAIKILLGGSPCTHWSIAQKNNRETEPSGLGWELFENYLIAKKKFNPDLFLYENNKSASQAIKDQIAKDLGVGTDPDARFTYINSALVSAQNRQRFYVTNFGDIEQPEDRGIVLRDILESGVVDREKSYPLLVSHQGNARDYFKKQHAQIVCEPVRVPNYGETDKSRPLNASYANKGSGEGSLKSDAFPDNPNKQVFDYVAEPIRIGTIESNIKNKNHDSKQYRVYSPDAKATTLCSSNGSMGKMTGLYATPVYVGEIPENNGTYRNGYQPSQQYRIYDIEGKGVSVTTSAITNVAIPVSEPIRVGCLPSPDGAIKNTQSMRVYSVDGKSVTQSANGGGQGGKTGLYTTPINTTDDGKSQTIKAQYSFTSIPNICCYSSTYGATGVATLTDEPPSEQFVGEGKDRNAMKRVYEVKDGLITIKGKQYPIKLADGHYIIRKLTPVECERLQTLPDGFTKYGREQYTQSFEKGLSIWRSVALRDVLTKSQTVATDCVTNIVYDCKDMELPNSFDPKLIKVKNAKLTVATENRKPTSATVCCTINDGLETELPNCVINQLKDVKFVVNQQLREDCVVSTIKIIGDTEMRNTPTILEMVLTNTDIKNTKIHITKLNIDTLLQKCSAENSQEMILSTILTLISQIMMKVTYLFAPKSNTNSYIINLNDVLPNSISWDILNLKTENINLISSAQRYKGIGNGWTAEVIIHLLNHALKDVPRDEEIIVLSMYDGIGTGRYCLDKMGFTNVRYYAYEIDKYAKQVSMSNYPDIIQCGDAFDLRHPDWTIGY